MYVKQVPNREIYMAEQVVVQARIDMVHGIPFDITFPDGVITRTEA